MALHVSVCLLAALTGLPECADRHLLDVLDIVHADHSSRLRALAYAGVVLCIALTVATAKNMLSGH